MITRDEFDKVLTDTWDTVRDILTLRKKPYWMRRPARPEILKGHSFTPVEDDGATGNLFENKQ